MNTNTTSTTVRSSSIAAIWADVRHAQRRMTELNRPWVAKRTAR